MLKPLVLALAAMSLATTVRAKDTDRRPPEREKQVEERRDWSGFYAGVNGGGATTSGRSRASGLADAPSGIPGRPRP